MQNGTRANTVDHRDFDLHRSFGSVVPPTFPDTYSTDDGAAVPNQDALGLEFGCTDFSQSELANDIAAQALYTAQQLEAVTHANQLGGIDVRTSLKAALSLGWIDAFFNVQPYQLDFFDSIRLAMLSGAPEKRSVSLGTPWFPAFEETLQDGTVPAPVNYALVNTSWHNWAVVGWKTIQGNPYLIAKSWQGTTFGDNGYCYFSRDIINSLMNISGSVAFTASNMTPANVQTIPISLIEWITSVMRNLLAYNY